MINIISLSLLISKAFSLGPPINDRLDELEGSPLTRYTSDLTRDILVKQIHSHNDYWRDVPLYEALSYGVQSVEADVWHFDGDDTIYVGHHLASLNAQRTFASLYVDPLVKILSGANPVNKFTKHQTHANGVFDTDSYATLYLFVDVKTDGNLTWPYIEYALDPLRKNNWLTRYNGEEIIPGPVTVIGTGNTPYDYVSSQTDRDYFFDAPLGALSDKYPPTLSPIASGSLGGILEITDKDSIGVNGLNEEQYAKLNETIQEAHLHGCMTRVWDVDWWPVKKQDALWRQIIDSGSDFLNADDLALASTFY